MLLTQWDGEEQAPPDIARKFQHTFALVRLPGEAEPSVRYFNSFGGDGSILLYDAFRSKSVLLHMRDVDVVKASPEAGVYALDEGGVAVVRRLPHRQWAEGLCLNNTLIKVNGETNMREIGGHLANHLFREQTSRSFEEGFPLIDKGGCLRLNEKYWLKKDKTTKIASLFRNMARVGSWTCGQFYWAHGGRRLQEELKDELGFVCQ